MSCLNLSNGDSTCPANLRGGFCQVEPVPRSSGHTSSLWKQGSVGDTPLAQRMLGVCWMDGCMRTLRRVMREGADGQDGGEGELRGCCWEPEGSFSHPQPTLPMPPPLPWRCPSSRCPRPAHDGAPGDTGKAQALVVPLHPASPELRPRPLP